MRSNLLFLVCAAATIAAALGCDGASDAEGTVGAASSAGGGDAAAGTGGGDEVGSGGADGEDAEPTRLGTVHMIRAWYAQYEQDPEVAPAAVFLATFDGAVREELGPADHGCSVTVIEACEVTICDRTFQAPERDPVPLVTAGSIEVEGLAVPLVVTPGGLVEDPAEYNVELTRSDEDGWPFIPGAALSFHAAGEVVPGFSGTVEAPGRLRVTSPALEDDMVIDRAMPLDIEWTAGPGDGRVFVSLGDADGPEGDDDIDVGIHCEGEVADGALRIPATALEELDVGGGATLMVASRSQGQVDAGDWRVGLYVSDLAVVFGSVEVQ